MNRSTANRFSGSFAMMKQALALACIVMWCIAGPAAALQFSLHTNTTKSLTAVLAVGPIELGDAEKLDRFLTGAPSNKNRAIYLASPGGNLHEGMKLGLYLRESRIKSVVEGGALCASACAVAFLGGTDANGKPWRSSSDNSELGFHAFSSKAQNIRADEVQGIVALLLKYGQYVDAPMDLLIQGFATPSQEMFWVPQSDLCALGIKLWSNRYKKFVCN